MGFFSFGGFFGGFCYIYFNFTKQKHPRKLFGISKLRVSRGCLLFCNYLILLADTFQTISLWHIYSSMIGKLLKQTERPLESIEISPSSKVVIVLHSIVLTAMLQNIFSFVGWKCQCGSHICYKRLQKSPKVHCSLLCHMSQKNGDIFLGAIMVCHFMDLLRNKCSRSTSSGILRSSYIELEKQRSIYRRQ